MERQCRKRLVAILLAIALVPFAVACSAQAPSTVPIMTITEPTNGAILQGPRVKITVQVVNWKLVDAGSPVAQGEGHLHFFIDQPASAIPVGQLIPTRDPAYVHVGATPYTSRELDLRPGQHTITAVMGDSNHAALTQPAPQTVTVTVK